MEVIKYKYCIIIIYYYPQNHQILQTLNLAKHSLCIVIDNTPKEDLKEIKAFNNNDKIIYYSTGENLGIAEAQNIGIELATKNDFEYVFFFDQDSVVSDLYFEPMLKLYVKNDKIGVLGPTVIDEKTLSENKSIIHKCNEDHDLVYKDYVISSGSLIAINKLLKVNKLNGKLFIDYVDYDLCWRLKKQGYYNAIAKNVFLKHSVGDKKVFIWKYQIMISSPTRYFYIYRNYLWLLRKNYTPFKWKVFNGIKLFLQIAFLYIFINNPKLYYKNIFRGIYKGLSTRL